MPAAIVPFVDALLVGKIEGGTAVVLELELVIAVVIEIDKLLEAGRPVIGRDAGRGGTRAAIQA